MKTVMLVVSLALMISIPVGLKVLLSDQYVEKLVAKALQKVRPKNGMINTLTYMYEFIEVGEKMNAQVFFQLQQWGYEIVDVKTSNGPGLNNTTVLILYK